MGKKLKLWTSMVLGASFSVGTGFFFSGCKKSEEEIKCEEQIRKVLESDAKINIDEEFVKTNGFNFGHIETEDSKYLLIFESHDSKDSTEFEITYSVDEDTFYNFKNNYSLEESKKEVDMVVEMAELYSPVKVVSNNKVVYDKTLEKDYYDFM